jgi:hypothetical protein
MKKKAKVLARTNLQAKEEGKSCRQQAKSRTIAIIFS